MTIRDTMLVSIQKFSELQGLFEQIKQFSEKVQNLASPDCSSALEQATNDLNKCLKQLENAQNDASEFAIPPALHIRMTEILKLNKKSNTDIVANAATIHILAHECIVFLASYISASERHIPLEKVHLDALIKKELDKGEHKTAQREVAKKQVNAIMARAIWARYPLLKYLPPFFIGIGVGILISFSNRGRSSFETAIATIMNNIEIYGKVLLAMLYRILPFSHMSELAACKDVFTISTFIALFFTIRALWRRPQQSSFARFFRVLLTVFAFPWCAFVGTKLLITWNFSKGWLVAAILILDITLSFLFGSMGKKLADKNVS